MPTKCNRKASIYTTMLHNTVTLPHIMTQCEQCNTTQQLIQPLQVTNDTVLYSCTVLQPILMADLPFAEFLSYITL